MTWFHQATGHYMNQCGPRSMSPYGTTKPQWVKLSHQHLALRFNEIHQRCIVMLKGFFQALSCYCRWLGKTHLALDPSHKSHNALDRYPMMHHFVTEMCTHVHVSVTKWCIGGYGTDILWDLHTRSKKWFGAMISHTWGPSSFSTLVHSRWGQQITN